MLADKAKSLFISKYVSRFLLLYLIVTHVTAFRTSYAHPSTE